MVLGPGLLGFIPGRLWRPWLGFVPGLGPFLAGVVPGSGAFLAGFVPWLVIASGSSGSGLVTGQGWNEDTVVKQLLIYCFGDQDMDQRHEERSVSSS